MPQIPRPTGITRQAVIFPSHRSISTGLARGRNVENHTDASAYQHVGGKCVQDSGFRFDLRALIYMQHRRDRQSVSLLPPSPDAHSPTLTTIPCYSFSVHCCNARLLIVIGSRPQDYRCFMQGLTLIKISLEAQSSRLNWLCCRAFSGPSAATIGAVFGLQYRFQWTCGDRAHK